MGEPLVFITRISMTVVLVVMTSVNVTKKIIGLKLENRNTI